MIFVEYARVGLQSVQFNNKITRLRKGFGRQSTSLMKSQLEPLQSNQSRRASHSRGARLFWTQLNIHQLITSTKQAQRELVVATNAKASSHPLRLLQLSSWKHLLLPLSSQRLNRIIWRYSQSRSKRPCQSEKRTPALEVVLGCLRVVYCPRRGRRQYPSIV